MRKIIVLEHISLDGVIQGPGGPEEDPSGGFAYGGAVGAIGGRSGKPGFGPAMRGRFHCVEANHRERSAAGWRRRSRRS